MNRYPSPARCTARRILQRGQAALILLGVLVAGSGYVLLSSLNTASLAAERSQVTSDALRQAKEALIARAVADANRPGTLPCPDLNDDGAAELLSGPKCPAYVGRLPWRTLNLPDLRDSAGERLWYALSPRFRDEDSVVINSNTTGDLITSGLVARNDVAAIVFAPGAALIRQGSTSLQNRGCTVGTDCDSNYVCTGPAPKCDAANFLDRLGAIDNSSGSAGFVIADTGDVFNDRLALLVAEDIFPAVEIRAARELRAQLLAHYNAWTNADPTLVTNPRGWYPWAAPFATPSTAYPGVNGQKWGLAPFSDGSVAWSSATISDVDGSRACTIAAGVLQCDATATSGSFTITARLDNVATALIAPPDASLVSLAFGSLSAGPSASWTLNGAARALDVTVTGTYSSGAPHRIVIARPGVPAWADTAAAWTPTTPSWLVKNNWHHVLYYGVSEGYSIQGTGVCGGGLFPLCLQVDNATSGAHAVVVAMGRPIPARVGNATICPTPAAEGCYLEGQNAVFGPPPDEGLHFEYNRRAGQFNDYVSVVASN
ncbi:MAG: hypothetical protein ACOZDY_14590 [Pseudomonadota bacterium]